MSIVGTRKTVRANGYSKDPMHAMAKEFAEKSRGILNESGLDIFSEASKVAMNESTKETLWAYFSENFLDPNIEMSAEDRNDQMEMLREQFENDIEAIKEHAPIGAANPVMGMLLPLHKNLLMNTIWDKGVVNKAVAVSPKITISMEQRILVDALGNEYDLYKDQMSIKAAIDAANPDTVVELSLPETGDTDILDEIGATSKDHLEITTHICEYQLDPAVDATWYTTKIETKPSYGEFDRAAMATVVCGAETDVINFTMKKDRLTISSLKGLVKKVKVKAKKDTSNGLTGTASVKWKSTTDVVEIPTAPAINTTISPEEVKDISALYKVDQLTKIMSITKDVMANYKDDTIRDFLEESFQLLDPSQKREATFSFKPPTDGTYNGGFVSWRRDTFMDILDTIAGELLNILNDPNMTITVVGRPDLIRKITPTEYSYQSSKNVGPVELDFTKTVTTSDRRVYQFISSQKEDGNNDLRIIINPRNSERIIYRLYDYQLYVSNEIRNANNPVLPAVHTFERFKMTEYQPIQGKVTITNPDGGYVTRP